MRICCRCGERLNDRSWQCPACYHEPEKLEGFLAFAPDLARESAGFEAHFFETLVQLEPQSFWFRSRNRLLCWAIERYFPDANSFFEIGCGTGFVLSGIRKQLPQLAVSGSEVFTKGLELAAKRLPGIELLQMDARRIPFADEFDVIGAFDVLEHIAEDELVLSQMYQAARQGGGILLTVPQHTFLWSHVDEYSHHVRRYSAAELTTKVERAGFEIVRSTSFVSLLLPLMLASRRKVRSCEDVHPTTEFNLSAPLNFLLERIMDLERSMIRVGISFPAGGSLLLMARKPNA